MSRIRIIHTTSYRYAERVRFGLHRLVVRPREGHDLQVEGLRLSVQPEAQITWHRDLFSNSIAIVQITGKADYLRFQSDVTVTRVDQASHHRLLTAFPVRYPLTYSSLETPIITGYLTPVYPEEVVMLRDWLLATFTIKSGDDAVNIVHDIGTWIREHIKYRRREDRGVQSPLETLALKSGSCRDKATLLLEAVRTISVASRFASGYLDSAASAAGRAATHAWVEVYYPEHGWFGFDPTLGEGTSHKHIVTGVSSHPRGVMPITGTYSGPPDLYLGMEVAVGIEHLGTKKIQSSIQPDQMAGTIIKQQTTSP